MQLTVARSPLALRDEHVEAMEADDEHVELWATAYHEAGHAVFAYHEYRLGRLDLVSASRRAPGEGVTVVGRGLEARGPYYEAWLALAGRAAEREAAHRRFGVRLRPFVADEDFVVAHEALFPGALRVHKRSYVGARTEALEEEQRRVLRWLRARWDGVEALAAALLVHERLPGEAAEAILRRFGGPAESTALRRYALRDPFAAVAAWWRGEDD